MKAAILFDFGGTLDYPAHWLDRFLIHYRSAGIELTREALDLAFSHATAAAYSDSAQLRQFNLDQTLNYLVDKQVALLEEDHGMIAQLAARGGRERVIAAVSSSFADESHSGLAASRAILRRLNVHQRLGVVSNFYGNLDRILHDAGLLPLFATVADSSRLGLFKPDQRIFKAALDAMAIAPRAALMVGDSLSKDCAPARALGMRTVWLRHHQPTGGEGQFQSTDGADFTISALEELEYLHEELAFAL